MKFLFSLAFVFCFSLFGSAQNIFPEKFEGCSTDRFTMEKDTVSVKLQSTEIARVLEKAIDSKSRAKIKGGLLLQVIVDTDGNSCLISIKNDTNIPSRKMKLKEVIDAELIWEKPKEKVSPMISVSFRGDSLYITRLGLGGDKGIHELKQ